MRAKMNNFRNEAHVVNFPAGHILSCDCWCEPSQIKWEKDPQGNAVLVVIHKDDSQFHHKVIIEERRLNRDWITRYLNNVRLIPEKRGTDD